MLDEVLYMQVRLFRMFQERTGLSSRAANRVFEDGGAWDFIAQCYDSLHLSGDEAALNDVFARLAFAGGLVLMLRAGDILYHGSYASVERIDLALCAPGKDFGQGFYLTSDHGQAVRFIPSSLRKAQSVGAAPLGQNFGFVSVFEVGDVSALVCYEFPEADAAWLRYVSLNRRAYLAQRLGARVPRGLRDADVVIGKIANDTTNRVITTYLNGLYGEIGSEIAEETAIRLLMPDRLRDQYCFRTVAAVNTLRLVGVERHDL